jgi:hypothetical protein
MAESSRDKIGTCQKGTHLNNFFVPSLISQFESSAIGTAYLDNLKYYDMFILNYLQRGC